MRKRRSNFRPPARPREPSDLSARIYVYLSEHPKHSARQICGDLHPENPRMETRISQALKRMVDCGLIHENNTLVRVRDS